MFKRRFTALKFPIIYSVYFLLLDLTWYILHDYIITAEYFWTMSIPAIDHTYDFIFVMMNAAMMFVILIFYIRREKKHAMELLESEEFYRLLFEKNPVPMMIFDIGTLQIMEANAAAETLYGYTVNELKKLKTLDIRPKEDYERFIDYNNANQNQNATNVGVWRHLKKDGTIFHAEIFASTINFKNKKARIVKIRDITDVIEAEKKIKNSLEEKELLLQEVQHRVKNNLQVIISLMKLELASTNSDEVKKKLLGSFSRIKTMSITYERIYHRGTLSLVQIDSLIHSLINHVRMSQLLGHEKINFRTSLTRIQSNVNFAVNIALILNEILSNSIQYAFPGDMLGEIEIEFYPYDKKSYMLEVSDNGTGTDKKLSLKEPETIGLQLISSLSLQIGAEAKLEIDNGFHYQFIIPVEFNGMMEMAE